MNHLHIIYRTLKYLIILLVAGIALYYLLSSFDFFPANVKEVVNEKPVSATLSPAVSKEPAFHSVSPEPTISPDKGDHTVKPEFSISNIPDHIFQQMQGNSWKEDCTLAKEDLRYLVVSYYGFDQHIHTGELIVNHKIADDILSIFQELLEAKYPIEKIRLIDVYHADDNASMTDNNTSSFNFRFVEGTTRLSNHAQGLAIDINPLYNPYVRTWNETKEILPKNGESYADREKEFPYKIDENDICYKTFKKYGFEWGGDWKNSKDYQHFQKY